MRRQLSDQRLAALHPLGIHWAASAQPSAWLSKAAGSALSLDPARRESDDAASPDALRAYMSLLVKGGEVKAQVRHVYYH